MNRSNNEIRQILSTFRAPERAAYPELDGYSRDDIYRDFFGGGCLYLTVRMLRRLDLQPGQKVLDLGCGKGETSVYMAQHCGVQVKASTWVKLLIIHHFSVMIYPNRGTWVHWKSRALKGRIA